MNVAVYCSAKDCIPEEYLQLGDELGEWLAREGHSLVYGGATGGLMSRVSDAFRRTVVSMSDMSPSEPGKIIGVVPNRIIQAGRKAQNCDTLFVVGTMAERKQRMRDLADCFVCLPGSYGTLDEMFDVIASGTVGEHNKPLYILNHERFYDGIRIQSEHMHRLAFLPVEETYSPVFVETPDELYGLISLLKPNRK